MGASGIFSLGTLPAQSHAKSISREAIVKLLQFIRNPREIRQRLRLNQEQFWTRIGVTQSGGSRYETRSLHAATRSGTA